MDFGIRAGDHQCTQFSHLGLCQPRDCSGWLAGRQTYDPGFVVAMHPVTQSLTVHARLTCGSEPGRTIKDGLCG
jgi:hypothetical protein